MKKILIAGGLVFAATLWQPQATHAATLRNFVMNAVAEVTTYKQEPFDDNTSIKQGSGVFVDNGGCLYTNSHVVLDLESGNVLPHVGIAIPKARGKAPEFAYEGEVLFVDQNLDLAYVCPLGKTKVFTDYFDRATEPQFDKHSFGDDVWALGYPASGEGTLTVAPGQIVGFIEDPDISEWSGLVKLDTKQLKIYKTDALAGPGISGGVLINNNYQLVGVPFAGTAIPGAFTFVLSEDVYQEFGRRLEAELTRTGVWPSDCVLDKSGFYEQGGALFNDRACTSPRDLNMEYEVKMTYKAFCSVDISQERMMNAVRRSQQLGDLSAWSDSVIARCGTAEQQQAAARPNVALKLTSKVKKAKTLSTNANMSKRP